MRALAQRVVDSLPPLAEDVVLTGSTSCGVADELSDVELLVAAAEVPARDDAARYAQAAGLRRIDTWAPPGRPILRTAGELGEVQVELIWWARTFVDERIARVLAAEIVDHQQVRTVEAIVNGVALRGTLHAEWLARLAEYPAALADAIVADAANPWNEPPRPQLTLLRPGDRLMLEERLVEDAQNILRIVFALNREWEPGWKRLVLRVEPLAVKPDRLAERIDAALSEPDRRAALRAMRGLAAETLALAPDLPAVVDARARLDELLEALR